MEKGDGLTNYERIRNAKIERNKAKLQEFGVHRIVNSMSDMVGSNQGKKRKDKDPARSANEEDEDYNPNDYAISSDEENESLSHTLPKKVPQSGGRGHVRFIAPRSLSRYSNFSKQRTDLGLRANHQDVSKRTRNEPGRELETQLRKVPISESESRQKTAGKMTMVDLILKKKQSQGEKNELSSERLDKAKNLAHTLTGGANEECNNLLSQEDQLEDPLHHRHATQHAATQHDATQYDAAQYTDSEGEKSQEDEDLNSLAMLEQLVSEEYTDDEIEQINLTSADLELDAIMREKIRGPSKLHHIHTQSSEKRKPIILNEFGQPIGPIIDKGDEENDDKKKKDPVGEFSRFLGTIAKDYSFAPLVFDSWRKVPNKDKMWQYVLTKYAVPEEGKDWVLKTIRDAWRLHKCRFKKSHYYAFKDDKTRWLNRGKTVPDDDFVKLLGKWKKTAEKIRCSRNRDRRMLVKNMHTVGPKSFAVVREEMKNEDPNKVAPSLSKLFERTRKRNEGKKYADSFNDTANKIESMANYVPPDDGSGPSDGFLAVMGKESSGRRRLYGRGVCNKKLSKVDSTAMSYIVPGEILESMKSNIVDDMRKERDEDRMKSQMVLENMQKEMEKEREKMQRELQEQRDRMTQTVLQKLLEKLPLDIATKYFT